MDRPALDVFHGNVGRPVVSHATIQQPGDVGMLQPGQNLAIAPKSFEAFRAGNASADHFDGDLFLELAVVALTEEYGSHSAAADFFHQPVWPHAGAGRRSSAGWFGRRGFDPG